MNLGLKAVLYSIQDITNRGEKADALKLAKELEVTYGTARKYMALALDQALIERCGGGGRLPYYWRLTDLGRLTIHSENMGQHREASAEVHAP